MRALPTPHALLAEERMRSRAQTSCEPLAPGARAKKSRPSARWSRAMCQFTVLVVVVLFFRSRAAGREATDTFTVLSGAPTAKTDRTAGGSSFLHFTLTEIISSLRYREP